MVFEHRKKRTSVLNFFSAKISGHVKEDQGLNT